MNIQRGVKQLFLKKKKETDNTFSFKHQALVRAKNEPKSEATIVVGADYKIDGLYRGNHSSVFILFFSKFNTTLTFPQKKRVLVSPECLPT